MFASELAALAGDQTGYRLRVRETRTEGRYDLARLAQEVPDWRERQTWACGPEGMLNQAEKVWLGAGIGDRLHLERFAVSRAAPAGAGGTVTFARSGRSAADRRGDVADGCGRGCRGADALRLPDGHLPIVRGRPGGRPRSVTCGRGRTRGRVTRIQTCISSACRRLRARHLEATHR